MIRVVIANELRLMLRGGIGRLLLFVAAIAAALAVTTSVAWRAQLIAASAASERSVSAEREELLRIWRGMAAGRITPTNLATFKGTQSEVIPDVRDPYVAGYHRSVLALLPALPLAGFAVGASLEQPRYLQLTTRTLAEAVSRGKTVETINPLAATRGLLDLETFVLLVAPLLLVGLMVEGLTREQAPAFARLLTASGIDRTMLVRAKVAAAGGITLAIVAAAIIIAAVLTGSVPSALSATMIWLALACGYILLWCGLAALVIARARSRLACATALLGLWCTLCVIAPALQATAARGGMGLAHRLHAAAAVEAADSAGATIGPREDLTAPLRSILGPAAATLPTCAMARADILRDYIARFRADAPLVAEARQAATGEGPTLLSPIDIIRQRLERLSGTDGSRYNRFVDDAERFQQGYRRLILAKLVRCAPFTEAEFRALPAFAAAPPDRDHAAAVALALLCGGVGLAFALSRPRLASLTQGPSYG